VESILARGRLDLRLIDNPGRSTAAGRNCALRVSRGDIIIPLDAHTTASPTFIAAAVAALDRSGADCAGGPLRNQSHGPIGRAIALAMSSPFGVGNASFRYAEQEQWTDTLAFGAYRRQVFDRIGNYDETMDRGEDDEFNFRLVDAGGRLYLTPSVAVTYFTRSTFRGLWQQYFRYGRAKVAVLRRHPARIRVRHFVPGLFVGVLVGGSIAGRRWRLARMAVAALGSVYTVSALMASIIALTKRRRPNDPAWAVLRSLPLLPVAFATMHLAYGLGSWLGLFDLVRGRR
jgi:GT2 family glycosyltransferase